MWVEEIAEHVNVEIVDDRGDLDSWRELDASDIARLLCWRTPRNRVVVGDTQNLDARRDGASHELGRRAPAIGCGCMRVKVDQRTERTCEGRPPWRSRSLRYSRMSSSRCTRSSSANSRKICLPSESSKRSP